MAGHVLLLTGSAPYLGGPHTWQPLRDEVPDVEFRDLDLLNLPLGDDFLDDMKHAIRTAADGARAVVAHGTVAPMAVNAVADLRPSVPVLLVSPMAITQDSMFLRIVRALLRGPGGDFITAAAQSKRKKIVADERYLRKQIELLVCRDKISKELIQEARERAADPRMGAFVERTRETLLHVLTPTSAFEQYNGACVFGTGQVDRKMRKRIAGTLIESAWSAPMLDAPDLVAKHLRSMLLTTRMVAP